jgi:hypothetical protein
MWKTKLVKFSAIKAVPQGHHKPQAIKLTILKEKKSRVSMI